MDPVKVPWELKGGSIYTKELVSMRSSFPGNKETYKIPVAIAFNVGDIVGAHIVETHNAHLRNQVVRIVGPWWTKAGPDIYVKTENIKDIET